MPSSIPLAPSRSGPPTILSGAGPLIENYDVLYCDVWGVVHDGVNAYRGATDALIRFRERGGTVILVTNAPVPKHRVEAMLEGRHVPPEVHDDIVSSGEIALKHMADKAYEAVHFIGPQARDAAFFQRAKARHVPLEDAEAIVCTGLIDDVNETAEDYRPLLEAARAAAERIRGSATAPDRTLVIGDAVRTDIAGAARAGLDALFIAGGIHRKETMAEDGRIDADKLAALFGPDAPRAIAAMPHLAW